MQWTVEAANPNTGEDLRFDVEAETAEVVEQQARGQGWLVTRVYPAGQPAAPPAPAAGVVSAAPLQYQAAPPPANRPGKVPPYRDITTGATILRFFAGLLIVFGLLSIGAGILIIAVGMSHNERVPFAVVAGAAPLGSGIILIIVATFLRMYAALAAAVRDIAQNSFRH